MATSLTSTSATSSSAPGLRPAIGDLPSQRPIPDHLTDPHRAPTHQPGSPSPSLPDDVHDPFAASLRVWARKPFLRTLAELFATS